MLDDLDFIARFDSQNALAVVADFPSQLLDEEINVPKLNLGSVDNVVLTGMGGSALAGLLVRDWLESELGLPFVVNRDYTLPGFVGEKTLVICSSYSGNTEETISTTKQAIEKKAQVVLMSTGGGLSKLAQEHKLPIIQSPDGLQPRMAVGFGIRLLAELFEELGLVGGKVAELKLAAESARKTLPSLIMKTPTADNPAKQIAEKLVGKAIWVYGAPSLASTAYKWKINFNENSKNIASYNEFPEFDHNEILGWTGQPVEKPFAVIELCSGLDGERIASRFEVTNRLLSGQMPAPIIVNAKGKTKIEQIISTVMLGDFVSVYLAVLNQVNPTKIEIIERLKKELG